MPISRLLTALVATLIAGPALAGRVAVVQSDDLDPYTAPVQPFLDALGEPADVYNLRGRENDADALASRLVDDPPQVVFALGAKAAWLLRKRLPGVPVVHASILSPKRFDIEGPNTLGISMIAAPERTISQLSSFFPDIRRVGILRGPSIPDQRIQAMHAAAKAVGVRLVVVETAGPKQVRSHFHDLALEVDAIWLQADRQVLDRSTFRFMVEETQRMRLPLVVETENMVRAGGMFAVVPDAAGVGRQAAGLVRSLLDGATADGTVAYANDVDVVLNVGAVHTTQTPFEALMLDFVDVVVE